jgi:hypothetical protein
VKIITYGLGGYDTSKPNNNIIESYEIPDSPEEVAIELAYQNALAKLEALGLTAEDIKLILKVE